MYDAIDSREVRSAPLFAHARRVLPLSYRRRRNFSTHTCYFLLIILLSMNLAYVKCCVFIVHA